MHIKCPHCDKTITVNGLGRKRKDIPLKNVYEALHACHSVGGAAAELKCSQGYIYNVLKEHGLKSKEVICGVYLKSPSI